MAQTTTNKQCGSVKKHNPFRVYEEHPVIRFIGAGCVEVIRDEWAIEILTEIGEVTKLIKTIWPEEPGWKIEDIPDGYRFKDMDRFKTVMFYLLARAGGAKKTEARKLVEFFSVREGSCLVDSLYDRLWRCNLEGYDCGSLIRAYAKIAKDFVEVLPPEERRRGRSN